MSALASRSPAEAIAKAAAAALADVGLEDVKSLGWGTGAGKLVGKTGDCILLAYMYGL